MSSHFGTPNPQTWVSLDLSKPDQMRVFLKQLSDWALWMQGGPGTGGIIGFINSQTGALLESTIKILVDDLGNLSTNPTVDCSNYLKIYIILNMNGANRTLTLTNLALGADVRILAQAVGAHVFKIAASDPTSAAYTANAYWNNAAGDPKINMTTTGVSGVGTGYDSYFIGGTIKTGSTNYFPMLVLSG